MLLSGVKDVRVHAGVLSGSSITEMLMSAVSPLLSKAQHHESPTATQNLAPPGLQASPEVSLRPAQGNNRLQNVMHPASQARTPLLYSCMRFSVARKSVQHVVRRMHTRG